MNEFKNSRATIMSFINTIPLKLEVRLIKDGNIYETPLHSFLLEGLVIGEQRFKEETPQQNIHYIRETKIQAQNEIIRLQSKIADIVSGIKNHSDNKYVINLIKERIKVQEYIIQFLDLLHSEYMNTYFLNTSTSEPDNNVSTLNEPQFDPQRIQVDELYRFNMIDRLQEYMNSIESYSDRVQYYMKVCKALGFGLMSLNNGSRGVFERPYWSRDRKTDEFVDEQGNPVRVKYWGLSYSNDEEHRILLKSWFIEQHQEEFRQFQHWVNESVEQRKARYSEKLDTWNEIEYANLQLKAVEGEINRFQQEYTDFQAKKTGFDAQENESVRQQRLHAPALVESELLGNRAINWTAFYRSYQLISFSFLWNMIAFKLFLIQQISKSQSPLPTSTQTITDKQGLSIREQMLIHCYEQGRVIKRGEPNYNDYITFATPTKRKSYANGSEKKAKSLVNSIRKILPHLSPKAVQQANSEINTIESNL
ncbi:hypothetical protein GCM10027592_03430 [Spirosoma flavus]